MNKRPFIEKILLEESSWEMSKMTFLFSEQDVDTVIRLLFHNLPESFECMSNPPGGDWSGLSMIDTVKSEEYRWISLKRVRGLNSKLPDHVFQITREPRILLIAVESKDTFTKVESGVGAGMRRFINDLLNVPPVVKRSCNKKGNPLRWQPNKDLEKIALKNIEVIPGIAALGSGQTIIESNLTRSEADFAISMGFDENRQTTTCSVVYENREAEKIISPLIIEIAANIPKEFGISFKL